MIRSLAVTQHNIDLPAPPSKNNTLINSKYNEQGNKNTQFKDGDNPETFHTTGQISPILNPANQENKDIQAATNQRISLVTKKVEKNQFNLKDKME